jgi:hypothetical protein
MSTGLQSFSDPANIGPLYPFAGAEVILAIVGIALWILFHILHTRAENREWEQAEAAFDERVLLPGTDEPGRGVIATSSTTVVAVTHPPDAPMG